MVRVCEERVDSCYFWAFLLVFSSANGFAPFFVLCPFVKADVLWGFCWGCIYFEELFESGDGLSVFEGLYACFCFKNVDWSRDISASDEA